MLDAVIGLDARIYEGDQLLDRDGTIPVEEADIAWTEIDAVDNVTLNLDRTTADVPTRASGRSGIGLTPKVIGLADGTIDLDLVWQKGDAQVESLRTAHKNRTKVSIAACDGLIESTGSEDASDNVALAGNFYVSGFTREEPLQDGLTATVSLENADNEADWYSPAAY